MPPISVGFDGEKLLGICEINNGDCAASVAYGELNLGAR